MQQGNILLEEINLVKSFKSLALAYEEISAIKMQRTRGLVLQNRDFLSELSEVFRDVRASYKKQIERLLKNKTHKQSVSSAFVKNGKHVAVLLSSNSKLYGDIVSRVVTMFLDHIRTHDVDIVIIGKLGKDLFDVANVGKPYTYFDIPDSQVQLEDLKPIVTKLFEYEKVTVFYGKFLNVFTQSPAVSDITGEEAADQQTYIKQNPFSFIFEPSLEKILLFFQTQIITSLFKQTVHESQLARHASRIKAMDSTIERINSKIASLDLAKKRMKRHSINKKQLETMSGMLLWKIR